MSEVGVCVECPKNADKSLKSVSPCPICQRLVCSTHSQPMLAYIPDFKHTSKIMKEAKKVIESHNASGLGHSCLPYTLDFWKNFDLDKELKRQRLRNRMDGFGYLTDEEIENISGRSLSEQSELQRKLLELKKRDEEREANKLKESFWQKLKTAILHT